MCEADWKTRKERIDKKLWSLGLLWQIIRRKDGLDMSALACHASEDYLTANGATDYALFVISKFQGLEAIAVIQQGIILMLNETGARVRDTGRFLSILQNPAGDRGGSL